MDSEHIAPILAGVAALVASGVSLFKGWKKERSEAEHSNVETIALLSQQLQDAYKQIGELRQGQEDLRCRMDYESFLLRGISRLTASLAANELSVPWMPISFDEFMQRKEKSNGR